MILEDLNITEEKFLEYLDKYMEKNPIENTLRAAGLLPYESILQVSPTIIKSRSLSNDKYYSKDSLKFKLEDNFNKNHYLESSKMKMIDERELDKDINTNQNNSLAA